jgi:Xaa-Pro aminopeptidase
MINSRVLKLRDILKKKGCTHLLISDLIDVEYVSGFRSSNAAILLSAKKMLLFSDFRYKDAAEDFCSKNPEWKFILVKEQFFGLLATYVPKNSILGFQTDVLTVNKYNDLKKSLKTGQKLRSFSAEIIDVLVSKTEHEIEMMKKAAQIGDKALKKLLPFIKPGVTELQVARKLERLCSDGGSEKPSFDTIVLFGKRAALPHGKPQADVQLKSGDWILIDFGCTYNGYCSDMTRTFIHKKASLVQKEIYESVLDAQLRAVSSASVGMKASELDRIARNSLKNDGLGIEFGHALGHGVGLRIHEAPRLSQYVDSVLQENSVITVEPGVYSADFGGVRIEDMIVLRSDGTVDVLTHFPKDLMIL